MKLLTKANLQTLEVKRTRIMAIETFKILNDIVPLVLSDLLDKRDNKYNYRYSNIYGYLKTVNGNVQEVPQSQTAANP